MTKREPEDLDGVDVDPEDDAASLLDRWRLHQGPPDPDSATVSRLDEARRRRDGPAMVEPPLADAIPLPVREPLPEPDVTPPAEGVRRPKHAALRTFPPIERATDSVTASRDVMDALGAPTPPAQAPESSGAPAKPRSPGSRRAPRHAAPTRRKATAAEPTTPSTTPAPPAPPTPPKSAAPSAPADTTSTPWHPPSRPPSPLPAPPASRPRAAEPGRSLNVEFEPKLVARRVVGVLLLLLVVATAGAAFLAYDDARPLTLGAAGTLLALTLVVWAIRAGSAPTYVAIRSGQLEVVRGKTKEKFDLSSRFTRIEVVGTPGRPGWKVLLGRFGRDPLVISGSIVDPKRFTTELERYRPKD